MGCCPTRTEIKKEVVISDRCKIVKYPEWEDVQIGEDGTLLDSEKKKLYKNVVLLTAWAKDVWALCGDDK